MLYICALNEFKRFFIDLHVHQKILLLFCLKYYGIPCITSFFVIDGWIFIMWVTFLKIYEIKQIYLYLLNFKKYRFLQDLFYLTV